MSVKGNTVPSESIKAKIKSIPEIEIPTKIEGLPARCDYIQAKIEPSQK